MAAAFVAAATMVSGAIVVTATIVPMLMAVMVAGGGSGGPQCARQQGTHRFVRVSLHARIYGDAHLRKRHARSFAHAAANQRVYAQFPELPGQRAMPGAVALDDALGLNCAVLHVIELELTRVPEVLKDFSIIIGNRNTHS